MARKALSKKTRFEVFKRDSFVCQYCGGTPPSVILHADHIIPVADGGDNDIDNLVTACADCNHGKGATPLSDIPTSLSDRAERMQEAEEQIAAYSKLLNAKRRRTARAFKMVSAEWNGTLAKYGAPPLSKNQKVSITLQFAPHLMPEELRDAMALAISRSSSPEGIWRYFCGICWRKIKGNAFV